VEWKYHLPFSLSFSISYHLCIFFFSFLLFSVPLIFCSFIAHQQASSSCLIVLPLFFTLACFSFCGITVLRAGVLDPALASYLSLRQFLVDRGRGSWTVLNYREEPYELPLKVFMPLGDFNIMLFLSLLSSAQAMVSVFRAPPHPLRVHIPNYLGPTELNLHLGWLLTVQCLMLNNTMYFSRGCPLNLTFADTWDPSTQESGY
jgi:hypothetical protein